jgi:glycosyltransferase involved in cell wall biosynthesis
MDRRRQEITTSRASFASRPTLTAIVPVYNERPLVAQLIERLLQVDLPSMGGLEVIAVDDGSTDGSQRILRDLAAHRERLTLLRHETNRGKGAALRTAIPHATGDLTVVQDADLEYDPSDLEAMMRPFVEDGADAVYGSRFHRDSRPQGLQLRQQLGNSLITLLSNLSTGLELTDVETCYKMFRTELLKSIPLRSSGFTIEIELTAKIAQRRLSVCEVPISYTGRSYREGKKITWRDSIRALGGIVRYRLTDDSHQDGTPASRVGE